MRRIVDLLRRAPRGWKAELTDHPFKGMVGIYQSSASPLIFAISLAILSLATPAFAGDASNLPTTRTDLSEQDRARVEAITKPATDFSRPEEYELMQGGAGTSRKRVTADAFSQSSANITFEEEGTFKLGNALFRKNWVSSPSST